MGYAQKGEQGLSGEQSDLNLPSMAPITGML